MKHVIKPSQAWIAALCFGLLLTGCGGGSSPSNGSAQGAGDRSASLSWNAPFTRVNGDSLAMGDLSGYIINYGQDPDGLSETVRIRNASTMEYTVNNLDDGIWYFTVQVEDDNGLKSSPSQQVSKII